MILDAECIECGKVSISPDGTWKPGEVCLFGSLFACSLKCAEKWAAREAAPGYRPGEPGFYVDEPNRSPAEPSPATPRRPGP
jgi:hypothetical protein